MSPAAPDRRDEDPSSLVVRNRRRGTALSCAECRRLKLKCSRVFPCGNCVKKGCAAICPEGSLTTGKGNRFVLANTEALHDKIGELSTRVRHLEDALAETHAQSSAHPHPLLTEQLLQIKRPLERERVDAPPKDDEVPADDTIDAMGSLSISQGGRSTFFGQTANSWYLLQNEEGSEDEDEPSNPLPTMPSDPPWLAYSFPFASAVGKTAEGIRGSLMSLLPRASAAREICDIYYRHAAWLYAPITQLDFYEIVFRPIYDLDISRHERVAASSLALLYFVLALGTLLDLDKPARSSEAMELYQLGRAALSLDSTLEEPSIPAIQALLVMCHFMFLADIEAPRWVLMGLVVKLAHSIGLHRDSGRWNLDDGETFRRRSLLYECYVYDSWQSLTFGRPPGFSMAHIDAKMPHEVIENDGGDLEMSFVAWKHRYASQCLAIVHDQAFGARTPTYKTIQDLDKKVRNWYIPQSLQVPGFGGAKSSGVDSAGQPSTELSMQRYCAFAIKEMTLFYMHRGFFAQALEDNPTDPMGSKWSASVLAAYTSACSFVGLIESMFRQLPLLAERHWFYFMHVFSCAIVLGSIAVKPRMALAPSALAQLEAAINLFEEVSDTSRTAKVLPILRTLKNRAYAALADPSPRDPEETPTRLSFFGPSVKNEGDEIASALGRTTARVLRKSTSPSNDSLSSISDSPSPPPPKIEHRWQNVNQTPEFGSFSHYGSSGPGSLVFNGPQSALTMDVNMQEFYDYPVGYSTPLQQMESATPPVTDINYSWQNFMAQFK